MSAEQITIKLEDKELQAMVEHTANGWGAACRFVDADYMVSHAESRETAIAALEHIVNGDIQELANNPDGVMQQIGARWEIRARPNAETA